MCIIYFTLVICDHCPPQPRGISRTFILCLQFPIVLNHYTVGTASWQNHDSLSLYCTAMVAYVYQTPTFHPHYGDNVKVKSQHICQAIRALLRGLGEAVVTQGSDLGLANLLNASSFPKKQVEITTTCYY